MLLTCRLICFVSLLTTIAAAAPQRAANQPQIGYLYPAGAQQGTTVHIIAGGQFLRNPSEVCVSGPGISASVIKYFRPLRNINREQRQLIQARLKEVRDKRLAEIAAKDPNATPAPKPKDAQPTPPKKEADSPAEEVKMPEHPLLYDLDSKTLRELQHITTLLFAPRSKKQPNRQLADMVLIEVTVASYAAPGNRELRLKTALGLTNPIVFQVSQLPEVCELEPNERLTPPNTRAARNLPAPKPIELPVLINGQIMPGDVDRFRFRATRRQNIVIETHARSLIPYLADAVPGWFQPTTTLYDETGRELAFADDYRFNPDPVLFYHIPETGNYDLEIRDSIYRGREDFVYRIAAGQLPFITQIFPLGAARDTETIASVEGYNLPDDKLLLDTARDDSSIRQTAIRADKLLSNSVPYAVDTLPESNETESNDSLTDAQPVSLPIIINGRIDNPNDIDIFRFNARAGNTIVAEICARRLNSPLDSLLRLTDSNGAVLQWNDDFVTEESHLYKDTSGLLTHHADSYLIAQIPADGTSFLHLTDTQHHGGKSFAYRLRISPPRPDFELRVTPSSCTLRPSGTTTLTVYALKKDNFTAPIELFLKNPPEGFELKDATIPENADHAEITLKAPATASTHPIPLNLYARARINDKTLIRQATPADDTMQAFLYRHLVPAKQLLVTVTTPPRRRPNR